MPERDSNGRLLPGHSLVSPGRPIGWRKQLKRLAGENFEKLVDMLWEAASEGVVRLADGRIAPLKPETVIEVRKEIAHMTWGKPVSQAEILAAEKATYDVDRLTEAELEESVAKIFAERERRRLAQQLPSAEAKDAAKDPETKD